MDSEVAQTSGYSYNQCSPCVHKQTCTFGMNHHLKTELAGLHFPLVTHTCKNLLLPNET